MPIHALSGVSSGGGEPTTCGGFLSSMGVCDVAKVPVDVTWGSTGRTCTAGIPPIPGREGPWDKLVGLTSAPPVEGR